MADHTTPKKGTKAPKTAPQEPKTAPGTPQEPTSRPVGRPSLGTEKKTRLNLTVSQEERLALEFVSRHKGQSISELLGAWAVKEARRISRKTGKPIPEPEQMKLDT